MLEDLYLEPAEQQRVPVQPLRFNDVASCESRTWQLSSTLVVIAIARLAADEPPDYGKQSRRSSPSTAPPATIRKTRRGSSSLDTYDELLKGGESGPGDLAGQSDQSLLIRMLIGQAKPFMPPEDNERPKPEEVDLLKDWIDAGAKGPKARRLTRRSWSRPTSRRRCSRAVPITAIAFAPKGETDRGGRHGIVELIAADTREMRHALREHTRQRQRPRLHADGTARRRRGAAGLFGEVRVWNVADGRLDPHVAGTATHLCRGRGRRRQADRHRQLRPEDQALGRGKRQRAAHARRAQRRHLRPGLPRRRQAAGQRQWRPHGQALGRRRRRAARYVQPADRRTVRRRVQPRRTLVAAAGVDNRIRVWRLSDTAAEGTNQLLYSRFAHEGPILRLPGHPTARRSPPAATTGTVKLWDAARCDRATWSWSRSPTGRRARVLCRQQALAAGRLDGSLAVYNAEDGKPIAPVPPAKPELASIEPAGVQPAQTTQLKSDR